MNEGHIPINTGDLPIEAPILEESNVYVAYLKRAAFSLKPSKKGVQFCALQFEIAEGDYEGMTVMLNYIPTPVPVPEGASRAQQIQAKIINAPFGRFCRAFKIDSKMPPVSLTDPDSIGKWQDWISQFYDTMGKITVRNQEYPEGSGRMRSGVNDFVF